LAVLFLEPGLFREGRHEQHERREQVGHCDDPEFAKMEMPRNRRKSPTYCGFRVMG
jgi:hypothetical protein